LIYALRFVVTGCVGFLVDAAMLSLLLATTAFGPATARLASFGCALIATWILNRSWSFGDRPRPRLGVEFGGYIAVQIVGFLINYAVFLVLVTGAVGVELAPIASLAMSSLSSATVTYVLLNWRLYRPALDE